MTADPFAALLDGRAKPSPGYIQSVVAYDPDTGRIIWRHRADMSKRWNTLHVGTPAFSTEDERGYKKGAITIDGHRYHFLAHQIAWVVAYGEWANLLIDHINGDKGDNRIANLRTATNSQNMQNGPMQKTNKSGFKGVSWNRNAKKWQSSIKADGKTTHLGYFNTKEDAYASYCNHAKKHFGEYARFQ